LASWYGQSVSGWAFFALSFVRVQARRALPLRVAQVGRSDAQQAASKAQAAAKPPKAPASTRRPGRPKGRKNTPKADVIRTPEVARITAMLEALLHWSAGVMPLPYGVLAGHFGNHHALHMARQHHLHLLAKLRGEVARDFPSTGP
jgi:hypothetical protein